MKDRCDAEKGSLATGEISEINNERMTSRRDVCQTTAAIKSGAEKTCKHANNLLTNQKVKDKRRE